MEGGAVVLPYTIQRTRNKRERKIETEQELQSEFVEAGKRTRPCGATARRLVQWYLANTFSFRRFFPFWFTLWNYKRRYLPGDIIAGLAEGIMAVPQGMAYSLLANLDPIYGLHCGLVHPLVYMVFGSSPHISMGVSAIEAVLVGEAVTGIIGHDAPMSFRVEVTIGMSVLVGVLFIIMRLIGMGVFAQFLAIPVLSAFATASAIIIATKQLKSFFGIASLDSDYTVVSWYRLATSLHLTNWLSVLIGATCLAMIFGSKFLNSKVKIFHKFPLPAPLLAIICSTVLTYVGKLDQSPYDLEIVGAIPQGLPAFRLPFPIHIPSNTTSATMPTTPYVYSGGPLLLEIFLAALPIVLIYFVIHISIGKTIARVHNYKLDPDQELFAAGMTNIVGSFFQCFPNAVSMSRTSVLSSIGNATGLHGLVYSLLIMNTLLFLTQLLYFLPMTCLAAITISGVSAMIDFKTGWKLFKLGGADFILWLACLVFTIAVGTFEGVVISLVLSIIWLIRKAARPSTAVLGQLPDTTHYRNLKRFPQAIVHPHILIFRFDASLHFANIDYFAQKLAKAVARVEEPTHVIIDASSITEVDYTALDGIKKAVADLTAIDVKVLFANWKGPMRDFLLRARFYDWFPESQCFLSIHDALLCAGIAGQHFNDVLEETKAAQENSPNENISFLWDGLSAQHPKLRALKEVRRGIEHRWWVTAASPVALPIPLGSFPSADDKEGGLDERETSPV